MITNDAELSQTMEHLERMYRALAALRRDPVVAAFIRT